jgi:hypothetical protein
MQQTLKEFLESIKQPYDDLFYEEDAMSVYDFQYGQYDLAQQILIEYFTERNFE